MSLFQNRSTQKAAKKLIISFGLLFLDALVIYMAFYWALYISFGCEQVLIPKEYSLQFGKSISVYIAFCLILYWFTRMYNGIWRFVSYHELIIYTLTVVFAVLAYYLSANLLHMEMPRRYYAIGGWLQLWSVLLIRFSYRFFIFILTEFHCCFPLRKSSCRREMLIGAGAAGLLILRDILNNIDSQVAIECIIDDDRSKKGCRLCGIPIVGTRNDIVFNVKKYKIDDILFAIPTASAQDKREILNICNESGCKLKVLPGIGELVNGEVTLAQMHDVTLNELLGRDPIEVKNDTIFNHLSDKIIMVTGGGGSIGSELCRQIAPHKPKLLIIFEIYENNAYDIQQELKRRFSNLNLLVLIGSVRDTDRLTGVFQKYHPEIVFHAAAHKHVPLMEDSPCEAIKNNVLGTYNTTYAALSSGCKRFILISTDKAVNPTNIMGASKRLCEMIVQSMNKVSKSGDLSLLSHTISCHPTAANCGGEEKNSRVSYPTEFVAVRFGNVLGSNGSVIPLFKKQIEAGGPVTVTHPDIIRYFMTIPEAVSLVLDAATCAKGGEIFVLDMGDPVKIDTLARNLIKLSGFTPDVDIKIEYSGLRPGEKLFEEKLMSEEGLEMTQNRLIHIAKPLNWDLKEFFQSLERLSKAANNNETEIRDIVKSIVSTFQKSKC